MSQCSLWVVACFNQVKRPFLIKQLSVRLDMNTECYKKVDRDVEYRLFVGKWLNHTKRLQTYCSLHRQCSTPTGVQKGRRFERIRYKQVTQSSLDEIKIGQIRLHVLPGLLRCTLAYCTQRTTYQPPRQSISHASACMHTSIHAELHTLKSPSATLFNCLYNFYTSFALKVH